VGFLPVFLPVTKPPSAAIPIPEVVLWGLENATKVSGITLKGVGFTKVFLASYEHLG